MPSNRIIIPIGVTVKKYNNNIIIGDTILPRTLPIINHNLFGTINTLDKKIVIKRKMNANTNDHNLILFPYHSGYIPIITKK